MSLNYKQNDELIPLYQSGVSPNQMDNTETDANDCVPIDTDIKVYRVGNSATNIPIQQAGIIETFVYRDSDNVRVTQRYTVNYNTSGTPTFTRTAIGDDNSLTWSEWSTFDNYSTDEQVVGRWIDGKPLYRKVYDFGVLPNNSSKYVSVNIVNLDKIVCMKGIGVSANLTITIPYSYPSQDIALYTDTNNTRLGVATTSDRSAYRSYITLEYTKTTD